MPKITQKELDLLFPETVVNVAGKDITIRPFSFAETRTVIVKLKDVLHIFNPEVEVTPDLFAQITDKAFDGVCDIIAMSYGLDRKAVPSFDNKTILQCITGLVECNKSFFVGQVGPMLEKLTEALPAETTGQDSPSATRS